MKLTQNIVAFRKGVILFPNNFGAGVGDHLAATVQAELMQLGYMLDKDAFHLLGEQSREWIVAFHEEIIGYLKKTLGADRAYTPFYRNFPKQVMEMSDFELFINAVIHYWSNGHWEPPHALEERGVKFENTSFKIIKSATESQFKETFTRTVSLNSSLTESDKEIVAWFIDTYGATLPLPPSIPFKETLCILAAKGLDVPVKSPTDVLRVAVYMSGGDVSLPNVPKVTIGDVRPGRRAWQLNALRTQQEESRKAFAFRKFKRGERRMLVSLLAKTTMDATEMQRHYGRWLRLGEILHVGEFAKAYPHVAEGFRRIREQPNGEKSAFTGVEREHVRTFNSDVDMAFARSFTEGMDLLATRPGEFARRLDWMLRPAKVAKDAPKGSTVLSDADAIALKKSVKEEQVQLVEAPVALTYDQRIDLVLEKFNAIGHGISGKVLFEMFTHFQNRLKAGAPRMIRLKSKRAKVKSLPPLEPLAPEIVASVQRRIMEIIHDKAAKATPMGKVWVDERLKDVPLPFSMRSINTSVKTYVRGTRIPFSSDAKVIRPFIHWHDEDGSEDLDLSCGLYGEDLRLVDQISWNGLKAMGCCHSGDIRHRQGTCAEYVDIPISKAKDHGVRYAVIQVYNYNARPMHSVKDCVFGIMEREHAQANEIFVPKTISNCMGLANEGTAVVVAIIDLKKRQYIWADTESDRSWPTLQNAENATSELLRSLILGSKMSVYDLVKIHADARGELVADRDGADVRVEWEDVVTDYTRVAAFMNV